MRVDDQTWPSGVQSPPDDTPGQPASGDIGAVKASSERISVGSGDENVAKIQLAARWAEAFGPDGEDSLESVLQRFYRAYSYIDSVTHSVAPDEP
jgi:hypothetical protein